MKLSVAIRDGAKVYKNSKVHYTLYNGEDCGLCALGTAMAFSGASEGWVRTFHGVGTPSMARAVAKRFPLALEVVSTPPPVQGIRGSTSVEGREAFLAIVIEDLHSDGWSREAIAEWVETIEKSLEPKSEPEVVVEQKPVGELAHVTE